MKIRIFRSLGVFYLLLFFCIVLASLPSKSCAVPPDHAADTSAYSSGPGHSGTSGQSLFQRHLDVVLFVYGLSFLLMGIVILAKRKKESGYDLADVLWLLAAFGIVHGTHDFVDMWVVIKGSTRTLKFFEMALLLGSFILLFEFGKRLFRIALVKRSISENRFSMLTGWWLSPVIVLIILVVSAVSIDFQENFDTLTRYCLGFSGGLLSGFGLRFYYKSNREELEHLKVRSYFMLAALSFIVYGFLGGLIVQKGSIFPSPYLNADLFSSTVGIPLQVFRAICAIIVAVSMGRILTIFDLEMENQLFVHAQQLENRVKERTAKLVEANDHLKKEISERSQAEDVRKKLEQQLRQAQKMEAVGQLAGGIAHDFNNILSVVLGYGELLKDHLPSNDSSSAQYVSFIVSAAEKGANLTQNLLTFSRNQMITTKPVDLNETVKDVVKFLDRVIGEGVQLKTVLYDSDLTVMADKSQIEQVLINICINARDAMPKGGKLTIETTVITVDEDFAKMHLFEEKGRYALISLSDTGIGMDEKTRERIFDPFFTTKDLGRGTGLGLFVVYGIIRQHNGYINVYSEPDKGSTFKIYLPLIEQLVEEQTMEFKAQPRGGTETLLLAEDDKDVRDLVRHMLEKGGYEVLQATNGKEALRVFSENKDNISLVILDVIMPILNGKEVYRALRKIAPGINVVFISGYTADILTERELLETGLDVIPKPVSSPALLNKVRTALDRGKTHIPG
jgi:signal transduction histidine kinase/ActR/RegA family two-component response regulator